MRTKKTTDNTKKRPSTPQSDKGSAARADDAETDRSSFPEYGAGVLFENDASDETEYLATIRRTVALEPEGYLVLAIVENAVLSFQSNLNARTPKKRRQFEEAEAWILDENNDALFSFESICGILGIEPSYLRRGLMAWKKEKAKVPTTIPAKAA